MCRISIDNGRNFCDTIEEIAIATQGTAWGEDGADWDKLLESLIPYMDDATYEELHRELSPCESSEFIAAYMESNAPDICIG